MFAILNTHKGDVAIRTSDLPGKKNKNVIGRILFQSLESFFLIQCKMKGLQFLQPIMLIR